MLRRIRSSLPTRGISTIGAATGFAGALALTSWRSPAISAAVLDTQLHAQAQPPSSAFLALLPDGDVKRKFILDCTGCHVLDENIAFPGGQPRAQQGWEEATRRMIGYAGAHTPFPIIAADRDPASTAAWITQHLRALPHPSPARYSVSPQVTEYPFPNERDLPHDLMLDRAGKVVITGMMSDRMWTLDPASGRFTEEPIPVSRANPRALDIDPDGSWWVLLGAPKKIARFDPGTRTWKSYDIGMYPHSIQRDTRGRIWFNGHFTRSPELIGYLNTGTGEVRTFEVPNTPALREGAGPIPYDLRIAPDGSVWGTELHGNRIFRFDPATEKFETHVVPTPHSGPRRADFDAAGNFWFAEYAANKLAVFDPRSRRFREYPLPVADALPYIARVDRRTGTVWVGTAAADAILRFDPRTERFTVYGVPSRGALIRHMDIDPRTGDVWAAYGAAPGIAPKIALLRSR